MTSSPLAALLATFLGRAAFTADRLALASGVPKATIVNWLSGRTRRTHDWRGLVRVAQALALSHDDLDRLLLSAGHPPVAVLLRNHPDPKDQDLFAFWTPSALPSGASKHDAAWLRAAYQHLAGAAAALPQPAPLPRGSRMPLHRNPLFTGRAAELQAVGRALSSGDVVGINQLAAATGLGGIGKTQLAVEVVHRYGQFFAGGVFWLSFAQASAVAREVADCGTAEHLALHPQFDRLTLPQQVQLVRAAWQSPLPRLLVFDNCEDEALLREWLPTSGGCRVLVTSRRHAWSPTLPIAAIALDVLDREASSALLGRYRPGMDAGERAAIAEQLGDLPLALHLAGSYLAQYRYSVSPAAFLAQIERLSTLAHPALGGSAHSPTAHLDHVARTFALSYDQLDPLGPVDRRALALLGTIAVLAPGAAVPRRLCTAVLAVADVAAAATTTDDALTRLLQLGLVTAEHEGAVRMHRLVREFVRTRAPATPGQAAIHAALLEQTAAASDAGDLRAAGGLQPHLQYLADAALAAGEPEAPALAAAFGYQRWLVNDLAVAEQYLTRACQLRLLAEPPRPLELAESYNLLGLLYQLQSRFAQAQAMFEQALVIWDRELGDADDRTIDDVNNLGYILLLRGRYAAAEGYLHRALRARYRAHGLVHPATARSLNNVGYLALKHGRYRRAGRYLRLALRVRTTLYPEPHPTTALTLLFLGDTACARGGVSAAWAYVEQSLTLWRAVFQGDHMGIAECLYLRGRLWQLQGDYARAEEDDHAALAMTERTLGRRTRDAARILRQLGSLARARQDSGTGVDVLQEALAIWTETVGADHPETASTHAELGLLYLEDGALDRAARHLEAAAGIREQLLPAAHPERGVSRYHLGLVAQAHGRMDEAACHWHAALAILRRELPDHHPDVHAVQRALAALARAAGTDPAQ